MVADDTGVGIPVRKDTGKPFGFPVPSAIEDDRQQKSACLMALVRLSENGFLRPITDFAVTGESLRREHGAVKWPACSRWATIR